MSEEMYAVDLANAIRVQAMNFGTGDVFVEPHECDDPSHAQIESKNIEIIAMIVLDDEGNKHLLVWPKDSAITRAFTEMDISYRVRALVEG